MQGRTAGGSDVPDISCSNRHTFGTTGGQDVYVTPGGKEVTSSHLLTFTRQKKKSSRRQGTGSVVHRGYTTHPRPGVSQVDSLRLRSEHSGFNELSPTPLIFNAYQHLKTNIVHTVNKQRAQHARGKN